MPRRPRNTPPTVFEHPLWEIQIGEDPMWHTRFNRYLLLNESRSVRKTYAAELESKGKSIKTHQATPPDWQEIALLWRWYDRGIAWDNDQMRKLMQHNEQKMRDMYDRHLERALLLQSNGIRGLLDQDGKPKAAPDMATAMRLVEVGIKLERQARGVPDHITEIAYLSDEQLLAKYAATLEELRRFAIGGGETQALTDDSWIDGQPDYQD